MTQASIPLRVLLISAILPADAAGGEVILQRHLVADSRIQLTVVDGTTNTRADANLLHRALSRLQRTRLAPWVEDFWALCSGRWLDRACHHIDPTSIDVVLTVAHGDAYCSALRFAKKHGLPLVSIFHDWWPDVPQLHAATRHLLALQFQQLVNESSRVLCVSEGMREALGCAETHMILYPIPDDQPVNHSRQDSNHSTRYRVGYMGNLVTYGPMLQRAIEESWKHPDIMIEVRGSDPVWPSDFKRNAQARGNWFDFAKGGVLQHWLESLDAFMVVMDFEPNMRRRMETSFPSKLTEYAKYAKPIIIWAPAYSSALKWGRRYNASLTVESARSCDLLMAVKELKNNPELSQQLCSSLSKASSNLFNANAIQQAFIKAMRAAKLELSAPSQDLG